MAKLQRKQAWITAGTVLGLAAALQTLILMGLGTYQNLPLFPALGKAYSAWGRLLIPTGAGQLARYYGSIPIVALMQAVVGALIYAVVTPPGPVARWFIAYVATTAAVLVVGARL